MNASAIEKLIAAEVARQLPTSGLQQVRATAAAADAVLNDIARLDVDQAVSEGRIPDASRDEWVRNLREAPGVGRRLLAAAPAGQYVPAAQVEAEDAEYRALFAALGWATR